MLRALILFLWASFAFGAGRGGGISVDDCTILTSPEPLPERGIVCGSPERVKVIVEDHLDPGSAKLRVSFRGYDVFTGTYHGVELFVANHEIGGAGAVFLLEEMIAHGAKTVIRLGTSDLHLADQNDDKLLIIDSMPAPRDMLADYGFPLDKFADFLFPADKTLVSLMASFQQPNVTSVISDGYSIFGFYAINHAQKAAYDPQLVADQIARYARNLGSSFDRDMECAGVLTLGWLRNIRTGCALQTVKKGGLEHAKPGTYGIPAVLNALIN